MPILEAVSTFTTNKEVKEVWARGAERFYQDVTANADERGMRVNPEKTQLLCISAAIHSDVSSYIVVAGRRVDSNKTMKIVGYTFGSKPGPAAHVEQILRKCVARSWILHNLKKALIPKGKTVQVYCAMIRPLLEYAAPSFHSLLTDEQSGQLKCVPNHHTTSARKILWCNISRPDNDSNALPSTVCVRTSMKSIGFNPSLNRTTTARITELLEE